MEGFGVPARWAKYGALLLASGLFLLFGIQLLAASYRLNDPFSFIMTFFASNFIILISAVGIIASAIKMVQLYRGEDRKK